jgi:hypothetical protein
MDALMEAAMIREGCSMMKSTLPHRMFRLIAATPEMKQYGIIIIRIIQREWCVPHSGNCPENCSDILEACTARSLGWDFAYRQE